MIPSIIGLALSWNDTCQAKGASLLSNIKKLLNVQSFIKFTLNKVSVAATWYKITKKIKTDITEIAEPIEATQFQPINASG